MKNLIKYTIGLPILISLTVGIYGILIWETKIIEFIIFGEPHVNYLAFIEDIKDLWMPIKKRKDNK